MKPLQVIIVDDERLAREELAALLEAAGGVTIIGQAGNASAAAALLEATHPDVLFLDIEMPGRNGFELLESLPKPPLEVVFVTAYNEFALRAFGVNAIDYLLKPVNPLRLEETLRRVRARLDGQAAPEPSPAGESPFKEDDQAFIKEGDRCWLVPVREIRLIESEGNHVRVHFRGEKPLIARSLASMEPRLPGSLFLRASRSHLVNRHFIRDIQPWFSGSFKVRLEGGHEVEFSRRQSQALRDAMGL